MKRANLELYELLRKRIGQGNIMVRAKHSSQPFMNPERDMGLAWHPIFKQACRATCRKYEEADDGEALEIIDMINNMLVLLYQEARCDNLTGLQIFNQMYDDLNNTYPERGAQIYGEFCCYVVQTMMCFFFTVGEMAIGLPEGLGERAMEFTDILSISCALSKETRAQVVKELDENGILPRKIDFNPLKRELDNYLEVVKLDQQRRYEKMKAQEERQKQAEEETPDE